MEIIYRTPDPILTLVNFFVFVTKISIAFSGHRFIKLPLLRTYIAIDKFGVVCLSETYRNASISNDDDSFELSGYNLFRSDHQSNTLRGAVSIFNRNHLPLKIIGIHYLQECIDFEVTIRGKSCQFVSLDHPPKQWQEDFKHMKFLKLML